MRRRGSDRERTSPVGPVPAMALPTLTRSLHEPANRAPTVKSWSESVSRPDVRSQRICGTTTAGSTATAHTRGQCVGRTPLHQGVLPEGGGTSTRLSRHTEHRPRHKKNLKARASIFAGQHAYLRRIREPEHQLDPSDTPVEHRSFCDPHHTNLPASTGLASPS